MSVSVPNPAVDSTAEHASTARRPWPRLAFAFGDQILEVRGPTLFVRLARMEIYVCTAEVSDWWTLREPGSFEAAAGKLRFSASRATPEQEP